MISNSDFKELTRLLEQSIKAQKEQIQRGGGGSSPDCHANGISTPLKTPFPHPPTTYATPNRHFIQSRLKLIKHPFYLPMLTIAEHRALTKNMPLPSGVQPELSPLRSRHATLVQSEMTIILEAISLVQTYLSFKSQQELIPQLEGHLHQLNEDFRSILKTNAATYCFQQWQLLHCL